MSTLALSMSIGKHRSSGAGNLSLVPNTGNRLVSFPYTDTFILLVPAATGAVRVKQLMYRFSIQSHILSSPHIINAEDLLAGLAYIKC